MPTNYGTPAPPRYFLREREPEETIEPEGEKESSGSEWRQFIVVLMRALLPFAEAKEAVLAAFREAGANAGVGASP